MAKKGKAAAAEPETTTAVMDEVTENEETAFDAHNAIADADNEDLSDDVTESETSDADEDSSPQEETDDEEGADEELSDEAKELLEEVSSEEGEDEDDLDEFRSESKKDNVQKRIDQLTAQIKKLESENEKLSKSEKPAEKPKYSEQQLKAALAKAFEDGDHDLAWEVFDYRVKSMENSLVDRYEAEKNAVVKKQTEIAKDWEKVVNDYSTVWDDGKGNEVYPNAKQELSLTSGNSLLYRLAMDMYWNAKDSDGNLLYANAPGGQRQAVADATMKILKKKRLSGSSREKKKMERKLAKAKKRSSIASTRSTGSDTKKISSGNNLDDYVNERKKFLGERT